jgi:hypothetical protein
MVRDIDDAALVDERNVQGDDDVAGDEERNDEASETAVCANERAKGTSGEKVQSRKSGIEEPDFFVGDEAKGKCYEEDGPGE